MYRFADSASSFIVTIHFWHSSNVSNTINYRTISLNKVLLWMSALISWGFQSVGKVKLIVCVESRLEKEEIEAVSYI